MLGGAGLNNFIKLFSYWIVFNDVFVFFWGYKMFIITINMDNEFMHCVCDCFIFQYDVCNVIMI